MKEGLVVLPEAIVILKQIDRIGRSPSFEELPLSEVPDGEAPRIKKAIALIQANPQSPNAFFPYAYPSPVDKGNLVNYRVVRSDSVSAHRW